MLREYQEAAIESIKAKFAEGKKRVILCMPTGAGKTVVMTELARKLIYKGTVACFITHRKELFAQIAETYGEDAYYIQAGSPKAYPESVMCFVAMVETLAKRELPPAQIYIIDEAHVGNFEKILAQIPESAYVLGVTATPITSKGRKEMKELYDDIVEPINTLQLQEMDFLAPYKHYVATLYDSSKGFKTERGEYTDESQLDALGETLMLEGMVSLWQKKGFSEKKTIVFCVNIEHSKNTCATFAWAGYAAEHLDADTSDEERAKIIERFKTGQTQVLCNVGILTIGFDCPDIEVVVLNRKTKSRSLYLQMIGRGSRNAEGKTHFSVLDMAANAKEHWLWNDAVNLNWTNYFHNPEILKALKGNGKGEAPLKVCPECFEAVHARLKFCGCGYEFPPEKQSKKAGVAKDAIELERINRHPFFDVIKRLEAKALQKGYKTAWVWHQVAHYGEQGLQKYAEHKGYKRGWVEKNLGLLEGKQQKHFDF